MVHISPATDIKADRDHERPAYALKFWLAQLCDVNPIRVIVPPRFDNNQRYHIAVNPPEPETKEVDARVLERVQEYFGVLVAREERFIDVYVVTAANGKPPAPLAERDDDGSSSNFRSSCVRFHHPILMADTDDFHPRAAISDISGIMLEGSLDNFCHTLEGALDRPVVNETAMRGVYQFDVKTTEDSGNDFLDRLRDQFNLNIAPAQRRVQVVVLRPR